jgi:hypothetical protein
MHITLCCIANAADCDAVPKSVYNIQIYAEDGNGKMALFEIE